LKPNEHCHLVHSHIPTAKIAFRVVKIFLICVYRAR
jgi:hypothetical protein